MKILVNRCWGGFTPAHALKTWGEKFGKRDPWGDEVVWEYGEGYIANRTNPNAIRIVEELGSEAISGASSRIEVVEIPDNATDWAMDNYDGIESIIYVVDGKLHSA